jgi:hypothetical protein
LGKYPSFLAFGLATAFSVAGLDFFFFLNELDILNVNYGKANGDTKLKKL